MKDDARDGFLGCSLVSLRAFREVAKCKSFGMAATHLAVTQNALRHHIKLLENRLNVVLLRRHQKSYELSDEGRQLFRVVDRAFAEIEDGIRRMDNQSSGYRIILGVLSSFANKWLIPRLHSFYRANPRVELIVRSVNHTIDVLNERVDLAVVNLPAPPESKNIRSELLWRERLFAVCSPSYLNAHTMNAIEDLSHCVLLHDETEVAAERGFDWRAWLNHHGRDGVLERAVSQYYSQSDLVVEAAVAGYGVALARTSLVMTELQSGALITPFVGADMVTTSGCYVCAVESFWSYNKVAQMREWLQAEAKKMEAPL